MGLAILAWMTSASADPLSSDPPSFLTTGRARFAFDHLGNRSEQLESVMASGGTAIYASGVGTLSYRGLPPKAELDRCLDHLREYNRRARTGGVRLVLSYLCATSITHIADFAKNWDDYFRGRPREFDPIRMLQQDIDGKDLPSWYGAPYWPADMWNPYWREYQKRAIKLAIESGHDGVFFDNPTVHPSGNYSFFSMRAWKRFLGRNGGDPGAADLAGLRGLTKIHPRLWIRFRTTEAADFLREMREYGRSLKPDFFLTANNSLNAWDSFYSQPRQYGYSIPELARSEDSILVEDMANQPRREKEGYVSYAQNLRMIPAIARGRYLNVCTLTPGEYTTPPDLMNLAIAECTAHDASYLVWSCWDPAYRAGMEGSVRRYHDFLSRYAGLLGKTTPVSDVLLIWPYDRWLDRGDCPTACWGRDLSAGNVQYDVAIEADVSAPLLSRYPLVTFAGNEGPLMPRTVALLDAYRRGGGKVVPAEGSSPSLEALTAALGRPSVVLPSSPGVRSTVRRSGGANILHLYNLNVSRSDNYHDRVAAAGPVRVLWVLPTGAKVPDRLTCSTPDPEGTGGLLPFTRSETNGRVRLEFSVPKLWIWAMVIAR